MKVLQLQFFFLFQKVYSYYLPCFNSEQILNSNSLFTYKNGVYDIADYQHPGGNKELLKTVGMSLETYVLTPKYDFHLNSTKFTNKLNDLYVGTFCNNSSTPTPTPTPTSTLTSTPTSTLTSTLTSTPTSKSTSILETPSSSTKKKTKPTTKTNSTSSTTFTTSSSESSTSSTSTTSTTSSPESSTSSTSSTNDSQKLQNNSLRNQTSKILLLIIFVLSHFV